MRIAFASCVCTNVFDDQAVWTRISEHKPDVLLLLGDMVYLDSRTYPHPSEMNVDAFGYLAHSRYIELIRQPQFLSLVRSLPGGAVFATWDDHDFLWNDANGADVAAMPDQDGKIARSTAYHEAFRAALAKRLLHGSFPTNYMDNVFWKDDQPALTTPSVGLDPGVMLHLCDVRTFRTGKAFNPKRRQLLGEAQRTRIAARIMHAPAGTVHLLACGTTLKHWADFPADMAWLRELGANHRLLVVSGDVHENRRAWIDTAGFAVHEVTSSGAAVRWLVDIGDKQENFGILTITPERCEARFYRHGQPQSRLDTAIGRTEWKREPMTVHDSVDEPIPA